MRSPNETSLPGEPAAEPALNFLVACAQRALRAGVSAPLRWPSGSASEEAAMLALARRHRVLPLLADAAAAGSVAGVPEAARAALREFLLAHSLRNLRLTRELFDLLDLFASARVPAIPLKGPPLAAFLYHDASLRQMDDLDFLVPEPDMCRARDLLMRAGYVPRQRLNAAQDRAYRRFGGEYTFRARRADAWVEIEPGIGPRPFGFRLGAEEILSGHGQVSIEGRAVPIPSAHALLLLLSAHGAKHLWDRLIWTLDVAGLILRAGPAADWDGLLAHADRLGARRMLLLACRLAARVAHLALPEPIAAACGKDKAALRLAEQVARRLATGKGPASPLAALRFHVQARERMRDRLFTLSQVVFRPSYRDWTSLPLPEPLFPLYYLTRPVRLAARLPSLVLRGQRRGGSCTVPPVPQPR